MPYEVAESRKAFLVPGLPMTAWVHISGLLTSAHLTTTKTLVHDDGVQINLFDDDYASAFGKTCISSLALSNDLLAQMFFLQSLKRLKRYSFIAYEKGLT